MNLAARITESAPGLRWHRGRLATSLLYRRAFGHIGQRTVIVSPLALRGVASIRIGDDCAVYEGAWLQCEHSGSHLEIGNNVYMGHGVHIHAVDPVTIGDGCFITDGVLISSGGHPDGDRSRVVGTGEITLGSGVFIGERAMILGGVTVGSGATIGAAAVVTRDVEPGQIVAGVPARPLKGSAT